MRTERHTGEPRLHEDDARWIEARGEFLRTLAGAPHGMQLEFGHHAGQESGALQSFSKSLSSSGKLTGEQADCALSALERMLTYHHITPFIGRSTTGHEEWRDLMMQLALDAARWRVPIAQTSLRADEMIASPPHESAFDCRPRNDNESADMGFCPAMPLMPDERFVWVTEAACAEISHAVSESEPSPLSADMFPAAAATVVFHTPVLDSPIVPAGALRWQLDEHEGEQVVWAAVAAPWPYPDAFKYQRVYCLPLGHVCEPYNDDLFMAHSDRVIWAVLQLVQTPLCARPKAERSEMRRAQKRAISRGREASDDRMHVIDLRKPTPGAEIPESERHVRAHWARGHMRRQWWPSLDQHIPQWIQTHVRGNPELGWVPGHNASGPPKRDVVWRIRGDEEVAQRA